MAARIPLAKSLTAGTNSASIQIRLADPPYLFDAPQKNTAGTNWTGSLTIESSIDSMPDPQGPNAAAPGGTLPSGGGVSDASARWETIVTLTPTGGPVDWRSPLRRIRVNGGSITGGAPDIYMLEGIRSLKNSKARPTRRQMSTRNGG